jgi:hypothetical protein
MVPLAGCRNLFRPATPQAPTGSGAGTLHGDYSDPNATLSTLALAIAAKGLPSPTAKNVYSAGFADPIADGVGFTATFDPEVARAYEAQGHVVPTWNLELENDFYTAFVARRTEAYKLRWTNYEAHGNDVLDTNDALLHRKYEVFLLDANGVSVGQIAVGIADLTFKRFGSRWAITVWDDQVDQTVGVNPDNTELRSFSYRRLEAR